MTFLILLTLWMSIVDDSISLNTTIAYDDPEYFNYTITNGSEDTYEVINAQLIDIANHHEYVNLQRASQLNHSNSRNHETSNYDVDNKSGIDQSNYFHYVHDNHSEPDRLNHTNVVTDANSHSVGNNHEFVNHSQINQFKPSNSSIEEKTVHLDNNHSEMNVMNDSDTDSIKPSVYADNIRDSNSITNPDGVDHEFPRISQSNLSDSTVNEQQSVCESEECKAIAEIIKGNMNTSADPCDDFYEYACGNWAISNPLPAGLSSWNLWSIMEKVQNQRVLEILSTGSQPDDILSVKLARKYYKSCINTDAMEKAGLAPIISILSRNGGWPLIMEEIEWNQIKYTWQRVEQYYTDLYGRTLFHWIDIQPDDIQFSKYILQLLPPKFPRATSILHHCYQEDATDDGNSTSQRGFTTDTDKWTCNMDIYAQLILQIAKAMAKERESNVSEEQMLSGIKDMVKFQEKLHLISSDQLDTPMNMALYQFQRLYNALNHTTSKSKINWRSKIITAFEKADTKINDKEIIQIKTPQYFIDLIELLDQTPERTIVNYVHWVFVSSVIHTIFTKETTNFLKNWPVLQNSTEDDISRDVIEKREKYCSGIEAVHNIIAYEYVKKYFTTEVEKEVHATLEDIRKEFEFQINESIWLNENTTNFLLGKLKHIKARIGYPSWYKNKTIMAEFYEGLVVDQSFLDNYLNWEKTSVEWHLRELRKRINTDELFIDTLILNSFYTRADNAIILPAADFNHPFFALKRPIAINFGIMGFMMGHEIAHAFDDDDYEYSENGEYLKWEQAMAEVYNEKKTCFIQQFDNYTDDRVFDIVGSTGYGNRTISENIADTVGIHVAFGAFNRRKQQTKQLLDIQQLPGLENISSDQLFFLSYANYQCENLSPQATRDVILQEPHGLARWRVIGSISNSKEFAEVFKCPIDSPMNPIKKCDLW